MCIYNKQLNDFMSIKKKGDIRDTGDISNRNMKKNYFTIRKIFQKASQSHNMYNSPSQSAVQELP